MKLAIVAYLHGNGGAERQITLLANNMVKRGHEVHLLILAEYQSCYHIDDKVCIHDLTYAENKFPIPIVGRYNALKRAYKDVKPDVTIHYNLQSAYLTLMLPKKLYKKAIYSERGDPYDNEYSGMLGKLRDWTVNRLDGLVFQSEGARDFFKKNIKDNSVIIHNSVNIPIDLYPLPILRDNNIVSVGRLHKQKNQTLLIDAFAEIASEFPEKKLIIYGNGDLKEQLQAQINSYNLSDRIILHPACSDIWEKIRTASLFVLSSDYEGMPNALMEAMALGIPSISTDCRPGGARTLIKDGFNGFVVPQKDTKALADMIRYVLMNPNVAERISIGGRKILDTHTEEKTFDKWENFIKRVSE
jgi:glycosyltransferase involved in cell wall biosynthesis